MSTVVLTDEELETLLKDQEKLYALMNFGVDNWDWYDDAMASLIKEDECGDL